MSENDDKVERLLAALRYISETENVRHVWKDGEYQGCEVTYAHPLMPELKTIFRPYIPLSIMGQPMPKTTRQYFLDHGWQVPPGENQ